jgi:hypothetical protein
MMPAFYCSDCGVYFFTPEGINQHPCIGYVPAEEDEKIQTIFVRRIVIDFKSSVGDG